MKTTPRITLTALAAGSLLLLAPAPAQAATASLVGISDGALMGEGVVLTTTLTYTCDVGSIGGAAINVVQRSGRQTASAFQGTNSVPCTGEPQAFELVLTTQNLVFTEGTAIAVVTLYPCDATSCANFTYAEEIELTEG
jgi:hypothetical protein